MGRAEGFLLWVVAMGLGLTGEAYAREVAKATPASPRMREKGGKRNPLVIALSPSQDSERLVTQADRLGQCLGKETGLYFKTMVASNYRLVVEGLRSSRVDVAFMGAFPFSQSNATALFSTVRNGKSTTGSAVYVSAKSGITSIEGLHNKDIAMVDMLSTTGYMLVKEDLNFRGIRPRTELFAGSHDAAIVALLNGKVHAAVGFYYPPRMDPKTGRLIHEDIRKRVSLSQQVKGKDSVFDLTKVVHTTRTVPSDPVVVRQGMPLEMKEAVRGGLLACAATHGEILREIGDIEALTPAVPEEYEFLRNLVDRLRGTPASPPSKGEAFLAR